jgi:DNA-binding NtrC family response regulator
MKRPFVLVIDDDSQVANTARFLLKRGGFEARSAYSAEEGLELAFEMEPDVIILDIALPNINGLEILRRLKAHAATAHIPVILTSGHDPFDCCGAFTFLMKPFDGTSLISATRNALASAPEPGPLAA